MVKGWMVECVAGQWKSDGCLLGEESQVKNDKG